MKPPPRKGRAPRTTVAQSEASAATTAAVPNILLNELTIGT